MSDESHGSTGTCQEGRHKDCHNIYCLCECHD